MGKGPFYRLMAKVFLTVGGLLAAFLLIYMNATIAPPSRWLSSKNYIAIFLYSVLTLAKREPVGLALLVVTLVLLILGGVFYKISKDWS